MKRDSTKDEKVLLWEQDCAEVKRIVREKQRDVEKAKAQLYRWQKKLKTIQARDPRQMRLPGV